METTVYLLKVLRTKFGMCIANFKSRLISKLIHILLYMSDQTMCSLFAFC